MRQKLAARDNDQMESLTYNREMDQSQEMDHQPRSEAPLSQLSSLGRERVRERERERERAGEGGIKR